LMRALGEGARIDWGNPGWLDYTALHMASLHGHIEIARLLLTAEANVSVLVRLRPALLRGCI
jgi:ankyrin repeat protein